MKRGVKIALISSAASLALGMQAATQYVAYQFLDNPKLGHLIGTISGIKIYFPWSVFDWVNLYKQQAPDVFTTAGTILVPALLVPAFAAVLAVKSGKPKVKEFGADKWGKEKDLVEAGLINPKEPIPKGVVCGKWGDGAARKILSYSGPEHQLVVGASRAGKGVGHVIPTLLSWPESIFVYDPKEEGYDISAHFRSKFSHCFFVNFAREDTACFNPLMEVPTGRRELSYCQIIAAGLVDSSSEAPGKGWDFFDKSSFILITAIILHVLYTAEDEDKNLGTVRDALFYLDATLISMERSKHRNKLKRGLSNEEELDEDGQPIPETHPEIARVAALFLRMSSKQRDAIQGTAITMLAVFSDPLVCEATSRSDFMLGDLMCGDAPASMYLQVSPADQIRLRPLTRMIISQLTAALTKHQFHDTKGRKKNHKLLTLIDEFPSLGRLSSYVAVLKQMAGYGLKAHLIVQSFKDIAEAYGRDATILDNMHVTIAFAGADDESNEKISKMTGTDTEMRESQSHQQGFFGKVTRNYGEQQRNLLTPGDVRELSYKEQLVFVTGSPPFKTPKLRYYEDPLFQPRATDIRAGEVGPDQKKRLDVPFPAGEKGHGEWIGVRAIYHHVPTEEELANLQEPDRRGGGTGRISDPAEAEISEEDKAKLEAANQQFDAEISDMAATINEEFFEVED